MNPLKHRLHAAVVSVLCHYMASPSLVDDAEGRHRTLVLILQARLGGADLDEAPADEGAVTHSQLPLALRQHAHGLPPGQRVRQLGQGCWVAVFPAATSTHLQEVLRYFTDFESHTHHNSADGSLSRDAGWLSSLQQEAPTYKQNCSAYRTSFLMPIRPARIAAWAGPPGGRPSCSQRFLHTSDGISSDILSCMPKQHARNCTLPPVSETTEHVRARFEEALSIL